MMKKNICFVALLLILVSCSAPYHKFNYAVRIKPEKMKKYEHEQLSNTVRNGTALEGEVLGVEYVLTPDSCFSFNPPNYDTLKRISFIDICNSKREPLEDYIEYIPLADIDLVGQHKIHDTLIMPMNEWNNENYFEDYNTPDVTHSIRAVPVTVVLSDTCVTPCPCKKKVDFECLECHERDLKWYFFEVKPLAAVYSNRTSAGQDESFKNLSIDLAAGVRFGANKQFGLGMLVSPGVKVMNSRDSSMHRNLNLNLYGRWDLFHTQKVKEAKLANQFNADADINERLLVEYELKQLQEVKTVRSCPNIFLYGMLGSAIDDLSLDAIRQKRSLNCEVCKGSPERPDFDALGANIDYTINWGLGIGAEVPLSSAFDLSIDVGYRSIGYGDKQKFGNYWIPVSERIKALVFRFGICF